jgi:hypothetical protein
LDETSYPRAIIDHLRRQPEADLVKPTSTPMNSFWTNSSKPLMTRHAAQAKPERLLLQATRSNGATEFRCPPTSAFQGGECLHRVGVVVVNTRKSGGFSIGDSRAQYSGFPQSTIYGRFTRYLYSRESGHFADCRVPDTAVVWCDSAGADPDERSDPEEGPIAVPDVPWSAGRTPARRLLSLLGCVAAMTLLGACGGPSPPSTPAGKPAPPEGQSAPAPPTDLAAQLAPFLGHWSGGHVGALNIQSDGTGRYSYEDLSTCPDAPLAGCGITGTTDFKLTAVANGTATGSATASSNPAHDTVGEPVTIVQSSANGLGVVLQVSIGKMQGWNFCNETSPHWCAEG